MNGKWSSAVWFILLGGWLATLVCEGLAATYIFMSVREVQAAPMVEPFNHPEFTEYGPNIVAGGAAQAVIHALHVMQGIFAVGLLICLFAQWRRRAKTPTGGTARLEWVRLAACVGALTHFLYLSLYISPRLSAQWLRMYSLDLPDSVRMVAREMFNGLHLRSEMVIGVIALCIVVAMVISIMSSRSDDQREVATN